MSGNGWIKLHRKFSEKGYYQRSQYVHLWVHLLLKANHKQKEYMTNGQIIVIKAGQFVTGRKQLSLETGIPESTIEDILKVFEKEQQIQQQKTTKYRLITIVNWADYQESDNKATTKQQQADTNKNDKNEKNTGELEDELRVEKESSSESPSRLKPAKYPNARTAFSWLPNRQESWDGNTTQLVCGELLFKRGEDAVRKFVRYVKEHEDDEGFDWIFVQPSDYERKWETIKKYAKRNR